MKRIRELIDKKRWGKVGKMGGKIIGVDYGTKSWDCMVYCRYNKKGEMIIEKIKYSDKKE